MDEHSKPENQVLAQKGERYRLENSYIKALDYFHQAIELEPNYAWALAHRGETYRVMNHYAKALADFNQAIKLNSNYAWAYAHRGNTYRLMARYTEAITDFSRAIHLISDYAWAYACRCWSYEQMKRYEEALLDFDRAIALDNSMFSSWRSDRGLLLCYCKQYAQAIEFCEQWLNKETTEDHLLLYSIAVAQTCLQGQTKAQPYIDKAHSALQSMVTKDTTGAVLYRLGGLAALEGKLEEALSYLQQATLLRGNRFETACHDPAWTDLHTHPLFQSLSTAKIEITSSSK